MEWMQGTLKGSQHSSSGPCCRVETQELSIVIIVWLQPRDCPILKCFIPTEIVSEYILIGLNIKE